MKFLTNKTESVFNLLADYDILSEFTFVGGSAVAYYLNHRLSEDLDFFTWHKNLPENIRHLIKDLSKTHSIIIANQSNQYLDLIVDEIKLTFFANDWDILQKDRKCIKGNIFAADLKLLCAMKINALSLRAKFRDYYDLYVMSKEKFTIKDIYNYASFYLPGITKKVFAMQLTFIEDIEDENITHLSPKYKVSLKDIQTHFDRELVKFF